MIDRESFVYFTDVASNADPSWLGVVPASLYERGLRSKGARTLLSRWLAQTVPLTLPSEPRLKEDERWLLKGRSFYLDAARAIGVRVLVPRLRAAVERSTVERCKTALGDEQYRAALNLEPVAARGPVKEAFARAATADSLRALILAVGYRGLCQQLEVDARCLQERLRLAFPRTWPELEWCAEIVPNANQMLSDLLAAQVSADDEEAAA